MARFSWSLIAIGLVLPAAFGTPNAETRSSAKLDLEPCINGGVSAFGRFPTQAMEDQFHAYVEWTATHGLDPLYAFEGRGNYPEPQQD